MDNVIKRLIHTFNHSILQQHRRLEGLYSLAAKEGFTPELITLIDLTTERLKQNEAAYQALLDAALIKVTTSEPGNGQHIGNNTGTFN